MGNIQLWDWRRRVDQIYATVRGAENPSAAWRHWCQARDHLFCEHPQSPLSGTKRCESGGLAYFDYDPVWRISVSLEEPSAHEACTLDAGADGAVALTPLGQTVGLTRSLGSELILFWVGGTWAAVNWRELRDAISRWLFGE